MDVDVPCEFSFNKAEVQNLLAQRTQADDDFAKYEPVWLGVFGWLDPNQGKWLFDAAKQSGLRGDIVEIGSAFGRSTVCLGLGAKIADVGKVYAIDPHTGDIEIRTSMIGSSIEYSSLEGFDRNVSRFDLQDWVVQIVKTSDDAYRDWAVGHQGERSIRLMFVDGWHTYDAVFRDIMLWGYYVQDDGIIAIHDYSQEQIKSATHDAMREGGFANLIKIDENMVAIKR
jgi:predicted O-methyltransferase YrrM